MKSRNQEKIGIFYVSTAHRDLSEICCLCSRFISRGQWYVRASKGIAHYRCAKKAGWKKEPKKRNLGRIEKIEREPQNKRIRVIKWYDR